MAGRHACPWSAVSPLGSPSCTRHLPPVVGRHAWPAGWRSQGGQPKPCQCPGDGRGTGVFLNVGGAPCAATAPIRKGSSQVSSLRLPYLCMQGVVPNTTGKSPNPVRLPHWVPNLASLGPTDAPCAIAEEDGFWSRVLPPIANRQSEIANSPAVPLSRVLPPIANHQSEIANHHKLIERRRRGLSRCRC